MTKKAELIKIANWKFRRMGKASKRVQIAQDVLAQIKVNKFKPQHGTYFYTSQMLYDRSKQLNLAVADVNSCNVCAIGAIFLGFVNRLNHCKVSDVFDQEFGSGTFMKNYLLEYFDEEQIQMIETAFEGRPISSGHRVNFKIILSWGCPQIEKSVKFTSKIKSSKGRLTKIMKNIIENNGTFVP